MLLQLYFVSKTSHMTVADHTLRASDKEACHSQTSNQTLGEPDLDVLGLAIILRVRDREHEHAERDKEGASGDDDPRMASIEKPSNDSRAK